MLGRTRFIVELHPDAWQWSGHTRGDLERLLDSAGLVARPLSGQRDPLGEHGQVLPSKDRLAFSCCIGGPLPLESARAGKPPDRVSW